MATVTKTEETRRIRYLRRAARSICKNLKIEPPRIRIMSQAEHEKEVAVGTCLYDPGGQKTDIRILLSRKGKFYSYRFALQILAHELTHAWEHSVTRGDALTHSSRFQELLRLVWAATPDGYRKAKCFPWEEEIS